jgi:hypothetical protein
MRKLGSLIFLYANETANDRWICIETSHGGHLHAERPVGSIQVLESHSPAGRYNGLPA